jgi:methylmalonyl-CoA mutase, N-terminal domain
MYDKTILDELKNSLSKWEQTSLKKALNQLPERADEFITTSSEPINRLYTPLDIADLDYTADLGLPGEYPYTRGVHPTLHRSKLWTMRMFAGFGTAEETNARFKYLLEQGQTGLSIAFDLATLMGYDTDQPEALGEFGKCGVAISSLKDMEILLDGIPLDKVSSSMTINSPAAIIWAMYLAAAEKTGRATRSIARHHAERHPQGIHRAEGIYLPARTFDAACRRYDGVRRAESSAVEYDFHFGLSHPRGRLHCCAGTGVHVGRRLEYVRWGIARGMDVDEFAPRLSFFFNAHNDFFEEIAKYRAARRIWAREMRETFKAKNPRSWLMRFHTQTAGVSLTAQQPENNVVRVAIQALAAVLGGTQSLHTNSLDEALALPSEHSVTIALRTQQIIAEESGVTNTVDPLGGSYFVEAQTNRMEKDAYAYFRRIEDLGGVIPAVEKGFMQSEISDAAYRYQREIDMNIRKIVGVNAYAEKKPLSIPILKMDPNGYTRQVARLNEVRKTRDSGRVGQTLDNLRIACEGTENTMPYIMECVHAYCTLGEIIGVMTKVFGKYEEPTMI